VDLLVFLYPAPLGLDSVSSRPRHGLGKLLQQSVVRLFQYLEISDEDRELHRIYDTEIIELGKYSVFLSFSLTLFLSFFLSFFLSLISLLYLILRRLSLG
jgi:hypothetical protein